MNTADQALINAAVEQAEQLTEAELVVVAAGASSDYFDADLLLGAITAFLFLVCAIYIPKHVSLDLLPLEVLIGFALGTLAGRRLVFLRRLFLSELRMGKAVARRARATFVTYRVSNTKRRVGLLLYASIFEGSVRIVPDLLVQDSIEAAELYELEKSYKIAAKESSYVPALVSLVKALTTLLSERLPPTGLTEDRLPNIHDHQEEV